MKYELLIRSRPSGNEPIPSKHERFIKGIRPLARPWGGFTAAYRAAKDAGTSPLSIVPMSRLLGCGIKASANYANRKYLPDEGKADDWVYAEFDAAKVGYEELIRSALEGYIEAFESYAGIISNLELDRYYFDKRGGTGFDWRRGIERVYPVNYWDRELCRRAFALAPEAVAARLRGSVEVVRLVRDGALVICSSRPMKFEEALKTDRRLRRLLRRKS